METALIILSTIFTCLLALWLVGKLASPSSSSHTVWVYREKVSNSLDAVYIFEDKNGSRTVKIAPEGQDAVKYPSTTESKMDALRNNSTSVLWLKVGMTPDGSVCVKDRSDD